MKNLSTGLVLVFLLAFYSCSFEYRQVTLSSEEKLKIPDVVLNNLTDQIYDKSTRIIELRSAVVRVFEGRRIQEIEDIIFTQFDTDGEILIEGNAGYASRNLDNDDILLSKDVIIDVPEQSFSISGNEFLFSPEQNLIWSPEQSEVTLIRDTGTTLIGRGFVFDLLLKELRFDKGARGVFEEESDEDAEPELAIAEDIVREADSIDLPPSDF